TSRTRCSGVKRWQTALVALARSAASSRVNVFSGNFRAVGPDEIVCVADASGVTAASSAALASGRILHTR
ncbi:MAG TPA: hypothetical protein VGA66_09760, partial [Mycobacterium sp.]